MTIPLDFGQAGALSTTSYSGFESRMLEINYNKSLFALLFLFSNTLLKFFDGGKHPISRRVVLTYLP